MDDEVDGRYTPRYRINDDRQINSISILLLSVDSFVV